MMRYLRLIGVQLRISAAAAMQYRANFIIEGFMTAGWMALTLLPLPAGAKLRGRGKVKLKELKSEEPAALEAAGPIAIGDGKAKRQSLISKLRKAA